MIHHTDSLRAAVRDLLTGRPTMPGVDVTREDGTESCANCGSPAVMAIALGVPRRKVRFCSPCGIRTGREMLAAADEKRTR